MKKLIFIMLFSLVLSGCGKTAPEVEVVPTPTPAPEFWVQEFFSYEEKESGLQFAQYSYGRGGFLLYLPQNWYYRIVEYNTDTGEFGLDFWPAGYGGYGKLSLRHYPEPFGVCGTGLVETEGALPGTGKIRVGYYDGQDYPSFISFYDSPGGWVLTNELGESWMSHKEDIEKILGSLWLDTGVIRVSSAEKIALEHCDESYDYLKTVFDNDSGEFFVNFTRMGGEVVETVVVQGLIIE